MKIELNQLIRGNPALETGSASPMLVGLGAAISSAADLIEEEAIDAFGRLSLARRL